MFFFSKQSQLNNKIILACKGKSYRTFVV